MNNQISERHARSLLVIPDHEEQRKWLKRIINERMTVRDLDSELKKLNNTDKEDNDDTDVPLVKSIDIDAIRKEATEIPNVNEESDIARKLREIEREKMFNPDIIPVDQAKNDSKGNFFNFLENEKVNMNMEEPILKTPTLNFELPKINNESIKEEIKPEPSLLNSNFGSSLDLSAKEESEIFDPVDLIETLDPNYEVQQEEKLGIDLKTAINTVRETKTNLENKGFNIVLEETDLNDSYQFIIKIKKD